MAKSCTEVRTLPDRNIRLPLLCRVPERKPSGFREYNDSQHGAMAQRSVRYHRNIFHALLWEKQAIKSK